MHVCMRVRESIRYVREVLQVSEHLARQTGELVAVQIEAPTGDTHDGARTHTHTHGSRCAIQRVSWTVCVCVCAEREPACCSLPARPCVRAQVLYA